MQRYTGSTKIQDVGLASGSGRRQPPMTLAALGGLPGCGLRNQSRFLRRACSHSRARTSDVRVEVLSTMNKCFQYSTTQDRRRVRLLAPSSVRLCLAREVAQNIGRNLVSLDDACRDDVVRRRGALMSFQMSRGEGIVDLKVVAELEQGRRNRRRLASVRHGEVPQA